MWSCLRCGKVTILRPLYCGVDSSMCAQVALSVSRRERTERQEEGLETVAVDELALHDLGVTVV